MAAGDLSVKLRILLSEEGAAQKIARVGSSLVGLRREVDRLADSSRNVRQRLGDGMDSISRQLGRIQALALAIGGLLQGAGMVGGIARTAAEFESLEAAMRTVFGSAAAASSELAQLRAESERLGVPLETLARAWLSFAAAARGTALEGQQAREVFTALAEASTVLGLSQDQLQGALFAVQQMISKGTVSSEELRQQLGERLYGAMQIAARSLGITTQAFSDLLERGMIPADRFLPAFARQLRQEFGQGVADASNTARAAFARLENALLELKLEFARSGFMEALVDAARQLTAAFQDQGFRQSVREFGALIGQLTRFVVEHGDKLVVLGGVLTGARLGAGAGRLFGPKGAAIGAGIGAVAGGLGAASLLPEDTASGEDKKRVMDVEAAVARLKRRIEETKRAAAAGLIKPEAARASIAADEQTLARLTAKPNSETAPPGAPSEFGRELMRRQWDDYLKQFRDKSRQLEDALAALREKAKAAGISEMSQEFKRAEAAIRAKFTEDTAAARFTAAKDAAEAELALLKSGLARAQAAYEAALEDRLISIRDFYAAKTAIETSEIDAEIARTRQMLAEQQRLASSGKTEAERIRAKGEAARLEAELITLNNKRADIEQANARKAAQAERELADALQAAREELAQLTGTDTAQDRRAAIERSYRDLRARLAAENDAAGTSLIDRLIDVKAAQANLAALEVQWRLVTERLRNAQEAIQTQSQAGLLTEAQARQQIVALQQQSAAEMQRLLPAMQQAAQAIGPEAVIRVAAFRNELERTRLVTDELAPVWNRIGEGFGQAVQGIVSGAQSLREALANIFRSIAEAFLQQMVIQPFQQWVAMQARMLAVKLGFVQQEAALEQAAAAQSVATKQAETAAKVSANAAEAGAGAAASQAAIPVVGPGLAIAAMAAMVAAVMALLGNIKKFAAGGYVTGPGTATSDSIPARLSAGEYVVRAAAVQRVGVAFLDAINGLRTPPAWDGQRLAFAAGGLVPAMQVAPAAPQVHNAVRIVNAIDPGVTHDHLQTPAGERVILNIIGRNARAVRSALQG